MCNFTLSHSYLQNNFRRDDKMNVLVCCSSQSPDNAIFEFAEEAAKEIAEFIVRGNHNLVFGGGKTGLMGVISQKVQQNRPKSKIFISTLRKWQDDLEEDTFDDCFVFDKLSERKDKLFELADVIVVLPGGLGTIDELFSAIEAKRTGEIDKLKLIIICNFRGYFKEAFRMIDTTVCQGFSGRPSRTLYEEIHRVDELGYYLNCAAQYASRRNR